MQSAVYGANNWNAAEFDDVEEKERFEKLMVGSSFRQSPACMQCVSVCARMSAQSHIRGRKQERGREMT